MSDQRGVHRYRRRVRDLWRQRCTGCGLRACARAATAESVSDDDWYARQW